VLCSVKWGMHLTTLLYILFGESSLFSGIFVSGRTIHHTVSEHMGAFFIYVLYKIAFIYLCYTVLIGRIIIGIINWKDCERKL